MNNIERFVKLTKVKLILMCLATLLPIVIVSSLEAFFDKQFADFPETLFLVLRYIVFALCELSIIFKIISYILIIKKTDFREQVYTKYVDERNTFLKAKTAVFTIKTILFLNSLLLIVFGFTNPIAFIVLAVETLIIVIIYFGSYYYYKKKY